MKFTKMHGCGNDYIYVNCVNEDVPNPSELARNISDRHFGVGGDGLILIKPSNKADFKMEIYNADGSEGEMCGNGIRCVAKYVYEHNLTKKKVLSVETKAGIKKVGINVKNDLVDSVTVAMGGAVLSAESVPVVGLGDTVICETVSIAGRKWTMTCVSMGNPHAVVFDDNIDSIPLYEIGPQFENNCLFPARINVEFVQVINDEEIKMRVWERGSGETMACGTGACASAVACHLAGLTGNDVMVHLSGGDLQIRLSDDNEVFMTGPAVTVFEGEGDFS